MDTSLRRSLLLAGAGLILGGCIGISILGAFQVGGFLDEGRKFASAQSNTEIEEIDQQAPDFILNSLDGEAIRLSELIGKPVLINFWASWCGPCIAEMPLIQERSEQYSDDLIVLGINAGENKRVIEQFVEEQKISFPILPDPGDNVQRQYQINAIPTSYFIDRDGKIQAVYVGSISEGQLDRYLHDIGVGE
jgi:thiol-disulfide isomerase/thioredoxin